MQKTPRLLIQILIAFFVGIYGFFLFSSPTYSDEVTDDLQQQIDQKSQELQNTQSTLSQVEAKIEEISNSNYSVSQKISLLNDEIDNLNSVINQNTAQIEEKEAEINDKQALLSEKQNEIDQLSSQLYMESRFRLSTFFLSTESWSEMVKSFLVKTNTISLLKGDMEKINGDFNNLTESKSVLEQDKAALDSQKKDLDDAYNLLAQEKAKLQAQLNAENASKNSLNAKLSSLVRDISQLQQYLLTAKSGGTVVDANSVPNSSSDPQSSLLYFRNNAPSGSFAVFAFGAYTNRTGLSQYGALARAEAGQSYQQILNVYYPGKVINTTGMITTNAGTEAIMSTINTTTYGTLNFEDDYLLRLNEMPESWSMQALEAQAIIARTYAINYVNNGHPTQSNPYARICTTESCQVIGDGKKTGAWAQAVAATRGIVLTDYVNGHVFSSQYAAVNGGIETFGGNTIWDTTTGRGDYTNWTADAYESISGVSWFYKTWFRKGYATSGSDCGHTSYLSNAEMADILNAYLLLDSKRDKDGKLVSDPRVVSVDVYKCWGQSASPYSTSDLKNIVYNPVTTVYSAATSNAGGTTSRISFYTNRGVVSISGDEFKLVYNMRAPSYLSIPQSSFTNINVEYK
jgi:peptidoglycan hydrolase-like amidase